MYRQPVKCWGLLVLQVGKRIYQDKQAGEKRSFLGYREVAGSQAASECCCCCADLGLGTG
jgi:hypothetical protein